MKRFQNQAPCRTCIVALSCIAGLRRIAILVQKVLFYCSFVKKVVHVSDYSLPMLMTSASNVSQLTDLVSESLLQGPVTTRAASTNVLSGLL